MLGPPSSGVRMDRTGRDRNRPPEQCAAAARPRSTARMTSTALSESACASAGSNCDQLEMERLRVLVRARRTACARPRDRPCRPGPAPNRSASMRFQPCLTMSCQDAGASALCSNSTGYATPRSGPRRSRHRCARGSGRRRSRTRTARRCACGFADRSRRAAASGSSSPRSDGRLRTRAACARRNAAPASTGVLHQLVSKAGAEHGSPMPRRAEIIARRLWRRARARSAWSTSASIRSPTGGARGVRWP